MLTLFYCAKRAEQLIDVLPQIRWCSSARFLAAPVNDLHGTASEHKGRSDHDRVAKILGCGKSLVFTGDHGPGWLLDVQLGEHIIPEIPVFCLIDVFWLCPPDLDISIACIHQTLCSSFLSNPP